MKSKEIALIQRKIRLSRATSVLSMSLVLFMLGMVGYLLLNARRISQYVQENVGITLMLQEELTGKEVEQLQARIEKLPYVRATEFISKEEAALELQEELGREFVDLGFLGYNPLSAAIDIRMKAGYAHPDSLGKLVSQFTEWKGVEEAVYQKAFIEVINENIRKVSLVFILFCALLLLIAFSVISNTIRLSVYARRFTIKTMQWVGATHAFIRKPFLQNSIGLGVLGALLANVWLMLLIYTISSQMGGIVTLRDYTSMGILFGFILFMGISLTWISTYYSVNKYLNTSADLLYY